MKTTLANRTPMLGVAPLTVAALLALVSLPGCGSTQPTDQSSEAEAEEAPAPKIDPKVGMTKDEIMTMYQGEPDYKDFGADGAEIWRYHMNAGAQFIPFNFGYRPEFDVIKFDQDGKVKDFILSHDE